MLIAYLILCLFFFGVGTYHMWLESSENMSGDKHIGVFVGVVMTAWTGVNLLTYTGVL